MIKSSEICFLINPHSGKKQGAGLMKMLKTEYPEITRFITGSPEEAKAILESNLENFSCFVIAGGDGTINQVLPFFINRYDKILAVYPAGSGNGFALETGFTRDIKKLFKAIQKGETIAVDIVRCNQYFSINVAGIGFDGYIADLFRHQKKRGFFKYIMLTVKALLTFSPFSATIEIGERIRGGSYMGIVVANTRQFGNHAYIAPKSDPTDGKLDVILIKKMPFLQLIVFFIRLFTKGVRDSSYISYIQTSDIIRVKTTYPFAHTDGEPITVEGGLDYEVLPGSIRLLKSVR